MLLSTFLRTCCRNLSHKSSPLRQYKVVTPGKVSPQHKLTDIPAHIATPSYAKTSIPLQSKATSHEIKSADDVEKMRQSCKLAKKILTCAGQLVKPGNTTDQIDRKVFQMCIEHAAYPSPLNYRGFPKSVCTSVNNCVCHGIPDDRPLENGDIINIDVTVYLNGFHGDCSKTFLVGQVDGAGQRLVQVVEECLSVGVAACGPGKAYNNIGGQIEAYANWMGYNVVPCFTGHGIGSYFHGPPDIYHCANSYPGKMEPGVTFTIEPVISEGTGEVAILEDGWTAITSDNSRSAQCEHTVLITETGYEILTE